MRRILLFLRAALRPDVFLQDRSGSVLAIAGVSFGVLMIGIASAVSLEEGVVVRQALQDALDSAVLAGARLQSGTDRTTRMTNVFWANFAQSHQPNSVGPGNSTATITDITDTSTGISMSASAQVNIIPYTTAFALTVSASASGKASTTGLELALVIDNTGSLGHSGMQATRDGAKTLINAVLPEGDDTVQSWISIVPFGAEVNFGSQHTDWLNTDISSYAYAPGSWQGCMMARTEGGHDQDDATPSEAPFTAYFYPSTYPTYGLYGWTYVSGSSTLRLTTSRSGTKPGDNSWATGSTNNITEAYNYPESPNGTNPSNPSGWYATGPNLGCPYQPIVPETSDRDTLLAAIDNMRMVWRGGTMINTGLQAGWLTISSRWKGLWGDADLPRDSGTQKIIVLMTDGINGWFQSSAQYPDASGDGDMTAYGRLKSSTLGTTTYSAAYTQLNAITSEICTNIKAQGITIYVLLFNHSSSVDATTQSLMQSCASSNDTYFVSPDATSLQETFSQIGHDVANVIITK
ncbi:hypothetical protein [Acetobacter sp.]|uniref:hypothetical protein n=1 Tax=Acetobacter sp. TaxID=440 RepID=UPI0039E8DB88